MNRSSRTGDLDHVIAVAPSKITEISNAARSAINSHGNSLRENSEEKKKTRGDGKCINFGNNNLIRQLDDGAAKTWRAYKSTRFISHVYRIKFWTPVEKGAEFETVVCTSRWLNKFLRMINWWGDGNAIVVIHVTGNRRWVKWTNVQ